MTLSSAAIDNSSGGGTPVVFLHGFGGAAAQWRGLQTKVSFMTPTLAFDLPGHGGSLDFPGFGPPKVAAKAVIAELETRALDSVHIVGHSMGGAVASLIALIAPEKVASLTLLASGGYGSEFNHPLLMRWASARSRDELRDVLPSFFADSFEVPEKMIDFQYTIRQQPGAVDALLKIGSAMSSDGRQGMLPVDDVLSGSYSISVIWGREDKVLPVQQAEALADRVDLHVLDGVGHSPAEEATELVSSVILNQLR